MPSRQQTQSRNLPEPPPVKKPPEVVSAEAGDPSTVTPVTDPQTAATQAAMSGQPQNAALVDENAPPVVPDVLDVIEPYTPGEAIYEGTSDYDAVGAMPEGVVLAPGEPIRCQTVQGPDGILRSTEDVHRKTYAGRSYRPTYVLLISKGQPINEYGDPLNS